MNWPLFLAWSAFGLAILCTVTAVLLVKATGSDTHDLESKLAAALEDELIGRAE